MTASADIDSKIASLGDWRGAILAKVRRLIREADSDVVEEIKWRKPSNPLGVPTWSRGGIICTGETYKDKVKLTFARGASLDDPFDAGFALTLRRQPGYDHSYYFISTFMADHLRWHAERLRS